MLNFLAAMLRIKKKFKIIWNCIYKWFIFAKQLKEMKVPEKLKETISQLIAHGDIEEIQRRSGFSRYRISKVIDGDDGSILEVITAVAEFYNERKEILSDYIN